MERKVRDMRDTTPYGNMVRRMERKSRELPKHRHTESPWTAEEIDYIIANYESQTDAQIAAHLGRSRNSVIGKRNRLRLKKRIAA